MAEHIEINSKEELFRMLDKVNSDKPKSINQRTCNVCGEKQYRIFKKGAEYWMGCKCKTARPRKQFLPK